MNLAVCVDALAALFMEFGQIDDMAHLFSSRIELVEMRGLGMAAQTDVYLAALRPVKRTPHGFLPVVADKTVVLDDRLLLLRELNLLGERRTRGESRKRNCSENRCSAFHVMNCILHGITFIMYGKPFNDTITT